MSFEVELTEFRGPLDLLLFLVKKHEVEIVDLPIAPITEQFLQYLEVLQEMKVDDVGEFVELASTLMEIKSRSILPRSEQEVEEPLEDPRHDLVRRVLEYKKFKDASSILEERGRQWQEHYPRLANDLPPRTRDLSEEPIREVELWDLVSAFGRILREQAATGPANIVYDDTPIEVHMKRIHARLVAEGRLPISELFKDHANRSTLVGIFLASLELVRHHGVQLEQSELFEEIWLLPNKTGSDTLNLAAVDDYDPAAKPPATAADAEPKPKSGKGKSRKAKKEQTDEPQP
jgi:segregation and condensation protein A